MLTSLSRLVSGHAVIKSVIVPCSIQSETIVNVCKDLVAPTSGNRFGCLNCFHSTTSRQKFYSALVSTRKIPELQSRKQAEGRTISTLVRSILEWIRNILMATLEPRYSPRHTSAFPPLPYGISPIVCNPSAIAHEDGNSLCSRHIFLSTRENLSR